MSFTRQPMSNCIFYINSSILIIENVRKKINKNSCKINTRTNSKWMTLKVNWIYVWIWTLNRFPLKCKLTSNYTQTLFYFEKCKKVVFFVGQRESFQSPSLLCDDRILCKVFTDCIIAIRRKGTERSYNDRIQKNNIKQILLIHSILFPFFVVQHCSSSLVAAAAFLPFMLLLLLF